MDPSSKIIISRQAILTDRTVLILAHIYLYIHSTYLYAPKASLGGDLGRRNLALAWRCCGDRLHKRTLLEIQLNAIYYYDSTPTFTTTYLVLLILHT